MKLKQEMIIIMNVYFQNSTFYIYISYHHHISMSTNTHIKGIFSSMDLYDDFEISIC